MRKSFLVGCLFTLCVVGWNAVSIAAPAVDAETQAKVQQFLGQAFGPTNPKAECDLGLTAKQIQSYKNAIYCPAWACQMNENGFAGYRQNSYAWSMAEFNGSLYTGTGRYVDTFNPMWELVWGAALPGVHPIQLSDAPDMPFYQDFLTNFSIFGGTTGMPIVTNDALYERWKKESMAEIWQFNPCTNANYLRYEAQLVPASVKGMGRFVNKTYKASNAMGFRKMEVFNNRLFAFVGGLTFAKPDKAFLVYSTTDGMKWTALPTPPAMGRETRATTVHNGRLYVGSGSGTDATVWCTAKVNPSKSDWKLVQNFSNLDPTNSGITSLASFNGKLYVGTENATGFQVWCGSGKPGLRKNDFVPVVYDGAGDRYNAWAATMKVFKKQLYVGSIGLPLIGGEPRLQGFSLIRIGTDNKWELLVGGGPLSVPVPSYDLIPLSGWPAGFGNPLNLYCWSLEEYCGKLYLGTFDGSVFLRYLSKVVPLTPDQQKLMDLLPLVAGADLWSTPDGINWQPITINGFGNPNNYGFRTLESFNGELIVGTANPFEGCEIRSYVP